MDSDSGSWYTYSDSGVWHYFDKCMSEAMQNQIPADYEVEVANSQHSGHIRCCHVMLDRNDQPNAAFAVACALLYANLFNQTPQFYPWEHEVPQDIKVRRVNEIHNYIESVYGDERNKNVNKFLIVVKFGVFTMNDDHYFDEDDGTEIEFVPASKSSIEGLEKVSDLGDGQECAICLEEGEGKKEAKQMPCKHVFHGRCIEEWLEKSHLCPLCRYAMPTHD